MGTSQGREFDWALRELRQALNHLAAESDEQIRYIHENRFHWDELALDFHAVYVLLPQLEAERYLTHGQAQGLRAIDRQLEVMSGHENARLWTDEALQSAPEWEAVRRLAQAALTLFSEECDPA